MLGVGGCWRQGVDQQALVSSGPPLAMVCRMYPVASWP